jgi:hypothetical protein
VKITKKTYRWARPLYRRTGKPLGVTWHNAAAVRCTADAIHSWHLANGWSGFAYHFFVQKDGKVVMGRPEWALGGHALGASHWLGVCCEGNYETADKKMPKAQLEACKWLHSYIHKKYGPLMDRKHRDMPGNSTACPGRWFPMNEITGRG